MTALLCLASFVLGVSLTAAYAYLQIAHVERIAALAAAWQVDA